MVLCWKQTQNPSVLFQLRVNQDEPMEDYLAQLEEAQEEQSSSVGMLLGPGLPCKEQMRTNVINEIMSTERDYIKHLKDICEVRLLNGSGGWVQRVKENQLH